MAKLYTLADSITLTSINEPGTIRFSHQELMCRHCHKVQLDPRFATELIVLRDAVDMPFHPTSCCRCKAHNTRVGGHSKSMHIFDEPPHGHEGTAAIDIATTSGAFALKLIGTAQRFGWAVGVNFSKNFIHLDRRGDVAMTPVLFSY